MHPTNVASNRRLGEVAGKAFGGALAVGGIGLLLALVLTQVGEGGWERFFRSYLMAFEFILSICLGALFFTMLQHAVKAGWSVVIRRLAEGVAANLTWIWILFIPILIAMWQSDKSHLYEWAIPGVMKEDHLLQQKASYLNPTFWTIRAVVYFGIWAFLAWFFVGNSIKQDIDGDMRRTLRMQRFAPPAFILYAFSQSFASIDWVMSLAPHWFSTMFPVYFFAASCCGYFALQILIMHFVQRSGRLTAEITLDHYQDAGKLLFAFGIVFWAYIGFSQFMLIWYANIPEETGWYIARVIGGWKPVAWFLLFGHFLGPFLVLLSRLPKRQPGMLAVAAAWMIFLHLVDIYWLVMPKVPLEAMREAPAGQLRVLEQSVTNAQLGFQPGLIDLACAVGLLALIIAGTARRLGNVPLIPERDPRLHESLAFENM